MTDETECRLDGRLETDETECTLESDGTEARIETD